MIIPEANVVSGLDYNGLQRGMFFVYPLKYVRLIGEFRSIGAV